eukprot:1398209-Pleurochrysis_carterae.AAC.1
MCPRKVRPSTCAELRWVALPLSDDELRGPLSYHHACGVRVAARWTRHDGGVGDPDAVDAEHAQLEVDDRVRIARLACRAVRAREGADGAAGGGVGE